MTIADVTTPSAVEEAPPGEWCGSDREVAVRVRVVEALGRVRGDLERICRRFWLAQEADDLIQRAAMLALEKGERVLHPESWLRGVVWNYCIRAARRRRSTLLQNAPLTEAPGVGLKEPSGLDLQRLREILSPREWNLLWWKFAEGLSNSEIAARLGYSSASIGKLKRRALAQARFALAGTKPGTQPEGGRARRQAARTDLGTVPGRLRGATGSVAFASARQRLSQNPACRLWEELPPALRRRDPSSLDEVTLVGRLVDRACAAGVVLGEALRISGLSPERYRAYSEARPPGTASEPAPVRPEIFGAAVRLRGWVNQPERLARLEALVRLQGLGLSAGEIANLKREDVDLDRSQLSVCRGDYVEVIDLKARGGQELRRWCEIRGLSPGPLFVKLWKKEGDRGLTIKGVQMAFFRMNPRGRSAGEAWVARKLALVHLQEAGLGLREMSRLRVEDVTEQGVTVDGEAVRLAEIAFTALRKWLELLNRSSGPLIVSLRGDRQALTSARIGQILAQGELPQALRVRAEERRTRVLLA